MTEITSSGLVEETVIVTSPDKKLILTIPGGTTILTSDNTLLSEITVIPVGNPPLPPIGKKIFGIAYQSSPSGLTFNPPVDMAWSYDPAKLPRGASEADLQIAFYTESTGQWETVPSTVDRTSHTIAADLSHFTIYAVIAPAAKTFANWLITGIVAVIVVALLIIFRRRVNQAFETIFPRLPNG
ncbi:MAG: hypothetical protein HYY80_02825 [Chloroflexi bacterium]|nr:hypothetical protein [Chloroflexota bacterium]